MSSRSLPFFDASQIVFDVFCTPELTQNNKQPRIVGIHDNSRVFDGVVESGDSLGGYTHRGCVEARHSLHFLRGRVLFNYLGVSSLEVRDDCF